MLIKIIYVNYLLYYKQENTFFFLLNLIDLLKKKQAINNK